MIVVSAATGQFGRLVVDHLLARAPEQELAIAVRNPAMAEDLADRGVQVRYADYDEPESLVSAFRGADRLLFISSPDPSRRVQHRNVVAAARDAGVGMLAYTSGLGADMVSEDTPVLGDHHVTEQAIEESGVPYVMLRHPLYTELFINASLKSAIEAGELTSNSGGRGMNTASRADLAEAAAAVVLTRADDVPAAYSFTGQLWTYPQLAAALSDASGRAVSYREVAQDPGAIGFMGLAPLVQAGGFEVQTTDLRTILGRQPAALHHAVAAALA